MGGVIQAEQQALEAGFAALRQQVKQKNLELAAAEQAEMDWISAKSATAQFLKRHLESGQYYFQFLNSDGPGGDPAGIP